MPDQPADQIGRVSVADARDAPRERCRRTDAIHSPTTRGPVAIRRRLVEGRRASPSTPTAAPSGRPASRRGRGHYRSSSRLLSRKALRHWLRSGHPARLPLRAGVPVRPVSHPGPAMLRRAAGPAGRRGARSGRGRPRSAPYADHGAVVESVQRLITLLAFRGWISMSGGHGKQPPPTRGPNTPVDPRWVINPVNSAGGIRGVGPPELRIGGNSSCFAPHGARPLRAFPT